MSDTEVLKSNLIKYKDELRKTEFELSKFPKPINEILEEAIYRQNWFRFENKVEIVFDRRSGLIFPNFEEIDHISYEEWLMKKSNYSLSDISPGKWDILSEIFFYDDKTKKTMGSSSYRSGNYTMEFDYPSDFKGNKDTSIYISKYVGINYIENFNDKLMAWGKTNNYEIYPKKSVLPVLRVLDNPKLLDAHPSLLGNEKNKIILDFFIEQDWIPIFEPFLHKFNSETENEFEERLKKSKELCDQNNKNFKKYYRWLELTRIVNLMEIQTSNDQVNNSEIVSEYIFAFDCSKQLEKYNFLEINNSVWKYCQFSQKWLEGLFVELDKWELRNQHLVDSIFRLNQKLDINFFTTKRIESEEKELFESQLQYLKKLLDISLTPLRSNLMNLLSEVQEIYIQLKQTNTLTELAKIEKQARPSFELLAEHSLALCTHTLKQMEWLDQSFDFVKIIVATVRKSFEDYQILIDKYQQDLTQLGVENNVDLNEIAQWFAEWRSERLSLLKQIQPLLDAGLNKIIDEQTVLDVLPCIEQYQSELDQFYLQKRLGIHTTYAFQPNGHRQEKLEKEQELTKLVHQFMQQLEKVIFNTKTTAQKIWLIRFSEAWQQGVVNQITDFLAKEQLIERDDVVLIMSEELRKVQQQNLAACLQDAQSYSEALAQREKDVNTLIFKMRKALQK